MKALDGFINRDMIEQITILDEIQSGGQVEAIPALFEIYSSPMGDLAVDEMVYHALISLLKGQDKEIIAGFNHPAKRIRLLCIKAAGENAVAAACDTLQDLLQNNQDDIELITESVRALCKLDDPQVADILLPFIDYQDATVVGLVIEKIASIGGEQGRDALIHFISKSNQNDTDSCLGLGIAFSQLAKFSDDTSISFLTSHIHTPHPTLRKIVLNQLITIGEDALPFLEKILQTGDKDEQIMSANVIGLIGHKEGANIITELFDRKNELEENLKFASYEALGRIPCLRSIVGLIDGLGETDEMLLISVVTALDGLCNPGVAKALIGALDKDTDQRQKILSSLISSKAGKLFEVVCQQGKYAEEMIKILSAGQSDEAAQFFTKILDNMEDREAAEKLKGQIAISKEKSASMHLLVADDSRAMLHFYAAAAAEMNVNLSTADDGLKALNIIKDGGKVDLLITDLNMPNMDGIELVKEIRTTLGLDFPIIMASTESEKSQTELASKAGVTSFITKPFSREKLLEKVASINALS